MGGGVTADESALLAAIRDNPEEDTPRLVYADWLDENDRPARAEFIRVQVDGAREENEAVAFTLENHSAELLALHEAEWLSRPCPACGGKRFVKNPSMAIASECWTCGTLGDVGGMFGSVVWTGKSPHNVKRPVVWERGFPHAVECSRLEDVLEEGNPQGSLNTSESGWRPTPWALAVATHHPTVREFRCQDREPTEWSDTPAMWERDMTDTVLGTGASYICGEQSRIPGVVFDAMEGESGGYYFMLRKHGSKNYHTRADALTALHRALGRVVHAAVKKAGI